ncbi:MAG: hypothetical protein MJZ28_12360 [Paludibacteraceae bacterium]|nr:hypothetical protein [Paludibacteraceae bacterium]
MNRKILSLIVALASLTIFSSCSSSDDDYVDRSKLECYVVDGCAYEKMAYEGWSFASRSEIEDYLFRYYDPAYLHQFNDTLDWYKDPLVDLLRSYDSGYFRKRALIIKCFPNVAELYHKVDGVYLDSETNALNVDMITQVYNNKKFDYSFVIVECAQSDLNRDVFWNMDFHYYEN